MSSTRGETMEARRATVLTTEQIFQGQLEDRAEAAKVFYDAETAALENSDDPQDRAEAAERRAAR